MLLGQKLEVVYESFDFDFVDSLQSLPPKVLSINFYQVCKDHASGSMEYYHLSYYFRFDHYHKPYETKTQNHSNDDQNYTN